jgi:hypothetical protein
MTRTPSSLRLEQVQPPRELGGLSTRAFVVGALGAAACVAGFVVNAPQFFHSYLVGWLLWLTVGLGCLGLLMLQHLSGGLWGLMSRRAMEAGARTLPLLLVLGVPLFFGLGRIFSWTDRALVAGDPVLLKKTAYLNQPFFVARTVAILLVFSYFAWSLSRKSAALDATGDPRLKKAMHDQSAIGLLLFFLLSTLLSFDWLMSLDPHWYSSLYGGIFAAGAGIAALAVLILTANWLRGRAPMANIYKKRNFHDWGKLLFAFVMFFTYLAISQFVIMYQGNLPEEVLWYQHRFEGGWQWMAVALLVFHFFFPFLILLSRDVKEKANGLAAIAGFVLFMRFVDIVWQATPTFHEHGFAMSWLDFAAPIAVGGLWVGSYLRELGKHGLLPVGEPALQEALGHE